MKIFQDFSEFFSRFMRIFPDLLRDFFGIFEMNEEFQDFFRILIKFQDFSDFFEGFLIKFQDFSEFLSRFMRIFLDFWRDEKFSERVKK